MKTKILYAIIALLILISGGLFMTYKNTAAKVVDVKEKNDLLKTDQDSLIKHYDAKEKLYVYEKQAWQASKQNLENHLKETNLELYNFKKKYNAQIGVINEYKIAIKDTSTHTILHSDTTTKSILVQNDQGNIITERIITDTSARTHIFDRSPDYKAIVNSTIYGASLNFDLLGKSSIAIDEKGKATLIDKNPYVEHTRFDTFVEKDKKKKKSFLAPLGIGVTIGVVGVLLLN